MQLYFYSHFTSLFWLDLLALVIGMPFVVYALRHAPLCRDYQYKPFQDLHFQEYAAEFTRAAPGTEMTIPLNPDWYMKLTKR
jgi:hypothetical protein